MRRQTCWSLLLCILGIGIVTQSAFAREGGPVLSDFQVFHGQRVWMDPDGNTQLATIAARSGKWSWQPGSTLSLGYQEAPVWLRYDIKVRGNDPAPFYMELGSAHLDKVEFYLTRLQQGTLKILRYQIAGDLVPENQIHLSHRFPLFELAVNQPGEYQVFIRLKTTGAVIFPVKFKKPEALFTEEMRYQALYGLFFGVMFVLAFYNGMVWAFIRERAYFYNMAFIASSMLYQASMTGFGQFYLWGGNSWMHQKSYLIGVLLSIYFAGRFAIRFLDLRNRLPLLEKVTFYLLHGFVILLIPVVFLPELQVIDLVYVLEMMVCVYSVVVMVQQCLVGNYWARYLLAGWSILILGTLAFVASRIGWFPFTPEIEYIHTTGLALGNLVVTTALAARIQKERVGRQEAVARAVSLEHATLTDALTGIGNRRYLDNQFPSLVRQCYQHRTSLAVLVVDADYFKKINDRFGHLAGDQCLRKLADILRKFARRDLDVLVRYGGEEFVLVLPVSDLNGSLSVAEDIRRGVSAGRIILGGKPLRLTVSIGLYVCVPDTRTTPEGMMQKADQALYLAKKNGRNRVEVHSDEYSVVNA